MEEHDLQYPGTLSNHSLKTNVMGKKKEEKKEENKFPFIAVGLSVVVEKLHSKDLQKTEGGIFIPETSKKENPIGKILARGEQCVRPFKVGDTVIYNKYANLEVTYRGKTYIMMFDTDIYFILKDEVLMMDDSFKKEKRIDIDMSENLEEMP